MAPSPDALIVLAAILDGRYSQVHRQLRGTG
ncbi:hypothetical protein HNR07_002503 [Nocardiopsis metallicus]|uniref:Uncharacterized protein n=1 Tax=Nocardiopsis metallicus TaxID=179819 RepID=A0A840WIM9_9ACTN|nr:hypothetical protein [Nocardiopsis metallicus]